LHLGSSLELFYILNRLVSMPQFYHGDWVSIPKRIFPARLLRPQQFMLIQFGMDMWFAHLPKGPQNA